MEPEKDIFEQWNDERESRPWYKKLWDKISGWWKYKGRYIPLSIKGGVRNLIKWFPIIWKDRDWDSNFTYDIISFKLNNMADHYEKYGHHVGAEYDASRMRLCVRLIQKLKDEYYQSEYYDYIEEKHWFEAIEDSPGYSSWESRVIKDNLSEYISKYPLTYKRSLRGEGPFNIKGREDDQKLHAMNMGYIRHNKARKLLFRILEENIESWWD